MPGARTVNGQTGITGSPSRTPQALTSSALVAPMSMYMSFFSTSFLASSASIRCGGLAPSTPGTSPAEVLITTRCPSITWFHHPPSGTKADKALFGDQADHEADLVHVAGQHDPRRIGAAALDADDAAQLVVLDARPRAPDGGG